MPTREHRDAAYLPSIESLMVQHVLNKGLGFAPGANGLHFTLEAIADFLGYEPKTLRNKIRVTELPRHPSGPFYRFSDVLKEMENAE